MKCPHCGTENQSGFKFCVKCGRNIKDLKSVNMDQVGMNGYYSEGESRFGKFTIGGGTFKVNDHPRSTPSNDLAPPNGLQKTQSENYIADSDEPFIPKLSADRVSLPEEIRHPSQQPAHGNMSQNFYEPPYPQQQMRQMQPQSYPQQNMPQMNGIPQQQMYQQPPVVGYDQNGLPVYGQPAMYQQPQFLGYDQNGLPVYSQPVMYQQPQFLGYDQNGLPVYSQPVMYQQPQIIGYDQNGLPVYGQMPQYQNTPAQQNIPQQPESLMQGIPQAPPPPMPEPEPAPIRQEEEKRVDVPDDFWEFFDGGKATKHKDTSEDDFFGKHSSGMNDLNGNKGKDINRLKRSENKRNDYMSDLPIADASKLRPNDSDKFNRMYMRKTDMADASQLEFNQQKKTQDKMRVTGEVSADSLVKKQDGLRRNMMGSAGEADADQLVTFVHEHKQAMMAQANHAVEAMPSRKKTYNDLIDEIELPENMKAKKTVRTETVEIPALPELQDLFSQG